MYRNIVIVCCDESVPAQTLLDIILLTFVRCRVAFVSVTLKEPRGGIRPPPFDIFCYISAGCYRKLLDFFPSSLALDLRTFI